MKEKEKNNRNALKEKKPKVVEKLEKYTMPRIQYQVNYSCNFRCQFCSIDKNKDKDRETLSINEIKNLFQEADKMGISRITISGGEPLLLGEKLDEIIKAINPELFYIQLDTNAYLLTKEKVKHLKNLGIDCIAPSLDSLNEKEHDSVRNSKGSFNKVIDAFDYIQEEGLNTFVQTIVGKTRLYSQEFLDFLKYFNNKNIGVYAGFMKPVGAFENNFKELINKEDLEYMKKLESYYNIFSHLTPGYGENIERNCVASRNIFAISPYGDCFPCIFFFCSMGNIKEESLKDIWERCIKLKPFQKNTCVMADREDSFIQKFLVKKVYGKKLPVHWTEVFKEEDFD